jgi:tetratricopeptide (TPR) repeat protein
MSQTQMPRAGGESMPLVTTIVVTSNKESQIRECLSGLMKQSVANSMEVVVVDQGSEQSEWAIIADLQRRHKNLISLRIPAGGGFAGVNLAARIASGRYLTVVDAADRMKDDALQHLAAALDKYREAMVAYGEKATRPDATAERLGSETAPHPMWRRELHDAIGGLGEGDDGLREFMALAAERFPVVHSAAPAQAAPQAAAELSAEDAYAAMEAVVKGENHLQAAKAVERHLEKYPQHAVAHNDLGALYYSLGLNDQALAHYRGAVELAPEETTYQKNLADMLYVEAGQVDEAIAIYLELHRKAPRDTETLLNLGIISEGVGQPAEAESFYQRALEIEPWNQAVRECLTGLRNRIAEEATNEEDELTVEEWYQKAQALVAQGDNEGAMTELEKVLANYPDFAAGHNDLAVLYHQGGRADDAVVHFEKATALVPSSSTYQKNLADFYFIEGRDVDGAIAIYLDQLQKEPRNVDTLMNLGKICTMLDRPDEAESFYGKVTQIEPWNQAARECLINVRRCVNG